MSLLSQLSTKGVEPDQKLKEAIRLVGTMPFGSFDDSHLFLALLRLNALPARFLHIDENAYWDDCARGTRNGPPIQPSEVDFGALFIGLETAVAERKNKNSLGTRDVVAAILRHGLEKGDVYTERPYTLDRLSVALGKERNTKLSDHPELARTLHELSRSDVVEEDFQFVLGLQGSRFYFTVASVLEDYVQENESGLLTPQRAILTHHNETFGSFTQDQILELEDLINSTIANEQDFQKFFEKYPHFFRRWDYREVHPQVYLTRHDSGPLVPDFILTDVELQRALILDLKLSSGPTLIRRQKNRDRFAAAISEARAQLLEYRDYFRDKDNREAMKSQLGMTIYEPRLAVVIGRLSEFADDFDRQKLIASVPDVEVVTYDEMLAFARRRRLLLSGETLARKWPGGYRS